MEHHDECAVAHVYNQMYKAGIECKSRLDHPDADIDWLELKRLDNDALRIGVPIIHFGRYRPLADAGVVLAESVTNITAFLQHIGYDMRRIDGPQAQRLNESS